MASRVKRRKKPEQSEPPPAAPTRGFSRIASGLASRIAALPPAAFVAGAAVVTLVAIVLAPWFHDTTTFGFHDWDVETSHRYLTLLSMLRYHEFPGWNPFACGGFPAWGYVEADTILVSPFLPAYLVLPLALALRVEVLGMAAIGAAGAWAAASRFSSSYAARALVAVLWAVNGRWALQTAAGHTWHLAYAWMPWCLYFFERARGAPSPTDDRCVPFRFRDLLGGGVAIAMLVYSGGIYPLPHTVLLLGLYAVLIAGLERSPRPLVALAALGALGIGLCAPKLLPLLDGFGKAPRVIESKEVLDPGAFVTLLTSADQHFSSRPARVTPYGWHEWGMYISTAGVLVLLVGAIFVQGKREAALKAVAVLFLILGFGAFHPSAPWTWLHEHAPVFRSQHVPSRFHYTAVLLFGLIAAAGLGRAVAKAGKVARWVDAGLAVLVFALAVDIGRVSALPMAEGMWMVAPDNIPSDRSFHFEQEPPFQYKRRDWAGPMYLAMLGNTGVINCYGTPPFDRRGAKPAASADFHGEAWIKGGGTAKVVEWSPNHAVIDVSGAPAGSLLVYNMNFDEGWSADAGQVVSQDNAVAVRLDGSGDRRITLRYRPPYLFTGVLVFAATVFALYRLRRRESEAT